MKLLILNNLTKQGIEDFYQALCAWDEDYEFSELALAYNFNTEKFVAIPIELLENEGPSSPYSQMLPSLVEYLDGRGTVICKKFLEDLLSECYANKIWLGNMEVEEYDWDEETV